MAKKPPAGAPAWLVTFADLMSLLVCFFVLIISFSVPDTEKLKIAAGSLRDAFGITRELVVTGMVELDGNPIYKFAQELSPIEIEEVVGPIPEEGRDISKIAAQPDFWEDLLEGADGQAARESGGAEGELSEQERFERTIAELRQALEATPELERLAEHLVIESEPEGLRLQIVDQARMSMFPLGSARMYAPTRALLEKVAEAIRPLPNWIEVDGHTDSLGFRHGESYDNWSLSQDRADATRRTLMAAGLPRSRFASIAGKAASEPKFPDDPRDPRNRRISIILLRDGPPPPEALGADPVVP